MVRAAARGFAIAFILLAPSVRADGAFPNAMQLLAPASNPDELHLATTFGLVSSGDGGKSWSYVCEPYITGGPNVSLYAREADGALLAISGPLWRSTDSGCTWAQIANPPGTDGYADLFADPTSAQRAFAVSFDLNDGPRAAWLSSDGAQSFTAPLADGLGGAVSVESSISDPRVIYVASEALASGTAPMLARSGDSGATWTQLTIPVTAPVQARILAVSPSDPQTLWLRVTHLDTNVDEVLASSDGGQGFAAIYSGATLTGFALLDDGTLALSDGTPGALTLAPGATQFARGSGPHLLCLASRGARLFGCGDSLRDGFNLAYSDDAGASWTRLLAFPDISGPAACVATACATDWQYQQSQFAAISPGSGGCAQLPIDSLALIAMLAMGALTSLRKRPARQG